MARLAAFGRGKRTQWPIGPATAKAAGGRPAVTARQSGQEWAVLTGLPWASSVMETGSPSAQICRVWPKAIWPRANAPVTDVTSIVRHRQSVSRGLRARIVSGIASDTQSRKWAIYHVPVHVRAPSCYRDKTKKPRAVAGRGQKSSKGRSIRQRQLSRVLS